MASSSRLMSEVQFQCSICLDVFTEPVSTPCEHNFCKVCISGYWDTTDLCQCPLCKHKFNRRLQLKTNTTLRDVADYFKRKRAGDLDESLPSLREMVCDVCTGKRCKALKSCLECQTSFCETHLQPHQRVTGLKRHKLIDPVENLEDRMCKKHDRLLELFCRTDQMCVCQFCIETDHKNHHTVPLEEECGERKVQLWKTKQQIRQMIREQLENVQNVKHSVELSKRDTQCEMADSLQVFSDLIDSIEERKAEFIEEVEKKQKAAENRAEGFIKELEQEITDLRRRHTELEQLSHTEDHLHLLQTFPSLCTPPNIKDWSEISVYSETCVGNVGRVLINSLSRLETIVGFFSERCTKAVAHFHDINLKKMQQYAVNVILDPDTAYERVVVSKDRKRVRKGVRRMNLPDNPGRFLWSHSVLGKRGYSSGKFYYEVQVKGRVSWKLGVARESIERTGLCSLSPKNGFWTVELRKGDRCRANNSPSLTLFIEKPQKVGVFVDFEGGRISFYNVEATSHIYSFIGCNFTEKLYPYLNLGGFDFGVQTSAPLVITPINHLHRLNQSPIRP
ncbi:E3 ubiquitin-protein ligase TRIM39-like [Salvelinus fontinalis]|uniref:E3 ubiquitin-protein ligase TRIM39-like n=1 Tax=Salvelinus fontinalis TaxID=8038 RepID=UPI002486679B|nr:E3 ubiquitin-protein ligase TRIM39-like [Salvelinus fontinalis]